MDMKKKGLSGIVVTMILILLTIAVAVIVWTVVRNLVEKETQRGEACFGIFEKVTFNNRYTCYNYSSKEFQFSINIAEVELDEAIILILEASGSKKFKIKKDEEVIDNLRYYSGTYGTPVKLPDKDGGTTYVFNWTDALYPGSEKYAPDQIKISPIINKKSCGVSDSVTEIVNCEIVIS